MRHTHLLLGTCAVLAFLAPAAMAQRATDPATGLAVDPPPGYVTRPLALRPPRLAAFGVRPRVEDGTDTGCEVSVIPAPGNARYTQAELNQVAASERYQSLTTQAMAEAYEVHRSERFSQAGIEGILFDATMRMTPTTPAFMANTRSLLARLETPSFRISTTCTAGTDQFERRRAEFLAVARGVSIGKPGAR